MRKLYAIITAIILLSTVGNSFAQVTARHTSLTQQGTSDEFEVITHNYVYNNYSERKEFRWTIIDKSNLVNGWDLAVCDKNSCYQGVDSQTFFMDAKDSGLLDIHFYPDGIIGMGCAKVYVYPIDDYNAGIELSSCADVRSVSIIDNQPISFNMYPSPVRSNLNIRFNKKGHHKIEVYNILGRKITEAEVQNDDMMRISFLNYPNGMYVIRYRMDNGKLITKTISKE